jgi:hypothetical protein
MVADTFLPNRMPTGANFMLRTNAKENQRLINEGATRRLYNTGIASRSSLLRTETRGVLTQRSTSQFALLIILCAGLSPPAGAQSSSDQLWPEIEGYYSFSPKFRLGVVASRSTDGASYNSIELGPTLNFFAKRFVQPVLSTPNEAENHMLVFGVGYRYIAGLNQPSENRIELDVTPQIPLPWGLQAGDRSRVDVRFIAGNSTSWRYRNRISMRRTFSIRRFAFSPYAQGEFFYSSSSGSWNKTTFQVGSNFPFRKHFAFELYYERDNNVGSIPNAVNAFGMTAYIYF